MANIENLLLQVRHVKALLTSAEAALSGGGLDDSKVDAAEIVIKEASEAFSSLLKALSESKQA